MKITFARFCLFILISGGIVYAEDYNSPANEVNERVAIVSINGNPLSEHPGIINVLPGEQISLGADILQFGDECMDTKGCRQNRSAAEFSWRADDRKQDECFLQNPEACRDHTSFEFNGQEIVFHIPYAMDRDITLVLSRKNSYSQDTIVLHNAHFATAYQNRAEFCSNDWDREIINYPSLAWSDPEDPYWRSSYPCHYWYGPYPYFYYWGWSEPIWFGYGGYYRAGYYGFFHPGYWHYGYLGVAGTSPWRPYGPRFNQGAFPGPGTDRERISPYNNFGPRRFRRGGR